MASTVAGTIPASNAQKQRMRFWLAWGVLGFGLPAAVVGTSKIVTLVIPAALHGSVGQRFLLWTAGPAIAEWLFVLALWFVLRSRQQSFRDLGVWRLGNPKAWALALALAAVSIASNLRLLPLMHVPIVNAFVPRGFHLPAALAMGVTAGFCEEVLFRAFLMVEAANAGYSRALQVVLPGIAFGFAHLGYSNHGLMTVIGIMVPTAVLGMLWGIAYLLGRRSLAPCLAAHFLNDATALPWINFFMFTGGIG
jgi:membrane protease YdiL (CAAX protease family)